MGTTDWKTIELADYVACMSWPDEKDAYRMIVRDVSRLFFGSTRRRQALTLAQGAPPLSGTNWDAMLAGVIEHLCAIEGHAVPAWTQEPARFLKRIWRPLAEFSYLEEDAWCPAAFLRHGALPDPRDFDLRCGYSTDWEPAR